MIFSRQPTEAPIADAYFQLGVVDDHFLYVRGLPFFGQTWSYLVAFAWMSRSYAAVDELLKRCKSKLSHYDFDRLGFFYECHKRSDYTAYVDRLSQDLKGTDARFPTGYQRTQLAALSTVASSDTAATIAQLEGISLAENDLPWLSDIALVHKARAYWKSGSAERERVARSQFMARQRMLFEPDHAYAFAFLDYQEQLRPAYQQASAN